MFASIKKSLFLLQTEEEAENWSPLTLSSPEATMGMQCQRLHFLSLNIWWLSSHLQCRSCDTCV